MLKSEMQHQFWVTKKTVQRKLGGKEDQCVVSSDTELDLKINLFDSISTTATSLYRVLDLYQERVTCLAMEETQLGKFLKEHGKLNQSSGSGKRMSTAGKAISYSGQQRIALRGPLVRLYSELDTFRSRAVADTQGTINAMERDRTEYRAALSWMKSITFDPDSDRELAKFRKAQQTVRASKERFDQKSLDCLEKIDLLAAARCNLFSHVLVAYQKAMEVFAHKTYETFKVASKILENEPHYAFSILRDLTQTEKVPKQPATDEGNKSLESTVPEMKENAIDPDQLLFFQDDYTDADDKSTNESQQPEKPVAIVENESKADNLISVDQDIVPTTQQSSILDALDEKDAFFLDQPSMGEGDLLNMDFTAFLETEGNSTAATAPIDPLLDLLGEGPSQELQQQSLSSSSSAGGATGKSMLSALTHKIGSSKLKMSSKAAEVNGNKSKKDNKDMSSWFKLFSELDPLANPDAMSKQIDSSNSHSA